MPFSCLNNNHLPGQFYVPTSSDFRTIPLLTLLKVSRSGAKDSFDTKFKKNPR